MRKVAILGGSFDPPHKGHITVAEEVIKSGVVDEVWLMPCSKYNLRKDMASPEHRVEMCKSVVNDKPNIIVSTFEIDSPVPISSTNELIYEITGVADYENIQFYYLIGMDNAINIDLWQDWENLIGKIPFIVVPRAGYVQTSKVYWFHRPPHIYLDNVVANDISSTEIREWIKTPHLNGYMDKFAAIELDLLVYINKHNLYKQETTVEQT